MIQLSIDPTLPRQRFTLSLDGVRLGVRLGWQERLASWYVDFLDSDNEPILTGRRIAVGDNLFASCSDDRLPPGMLLVIDTTGTDVDPGSADLGDRVLLIYATEAEVAAAAEAA